MRKLLLKSAPSCIYIHPPDPCNDCKNKVSLLLDKIIAYGTCKNRKLILISVLVTHRFQWHNVSSFLNLQLRHKTTPYYINKISCLECEMVRSRSIENNLMRLYVIFFFFQMSCRVRILLSLELYRIL